MLKRGRIAQKMVANEGDIFVKLVESIVEKGCYLLGASVKSTGTSEVLRLICKTKKGYR